MSVKNERINSNIQREISYILANEVKNPHIIDNAQCIKCGNCKSVCKFNAVEVK